MRTAAHTFARKSDASRWLTFKEAEVRTGDWIDPDAARVTFGDYAEQWLGDRVLKVRTEELYRGLLRNHLLPFFGNVSMDDIDEAAVRRWRKGRLRAGPTAARPFGPVVVAKAYRLLHAIFTTAAGDRLVRRNPCRIEGGGQEESPERETLSLPVVLEIAGTIPVRYRVLVLLATFAGLRWGELIALRRHSIDLEACEIRIVETTAQLDTGRLQAEMPKSRAGRRTVAFPAELVPEIRWHLERFAEPGERGLVFVGPKGARLRRSNFGRIWVKACAKAGVPGVHLLSRPGARFRCCHRPVSPDRSPNPPCQLPGNGLSTVPAVMRGSQVAMGLGSCSPGRRSGRPSRFRAGSTRPRPLL
jgi:integrase